MSYHDFVVKSYDGLKLQSRTWAVPENVPLRGRILFLHGFGEFVDNFVDWFPLVAEAGYETTSYDQRGHGTTALSPKEFGKSNEAGVMGDIETMVTYVLEANKETKVPLILWGFSMGGANCLNYMVIGKNKEKIDLYIAAGPYIETHPSTRKGLNAAKLWILPYIARIYPGYTDSASLSPEIANNNPAKWELYKTQKLRHSRTTAEFMCDAVNRGRRLLDPSFISKIAQRPLLLCHGTGDQICDVEGTKKFYEIVPLQDKTLDLYPELPHELMQCLDKDRLEHWRRVREWLDSHTPSATKTAPSATTSAHPATPVSKN